MDKFCEEPREEIDAIEYSCTCGMSDEEETSLKIARFWLQGYVQIIINTVGLIANSVTMHVLNSIIRKSTFNRTLFFLALFDSIFNVCDILESIRKIHYDRQSCASMPIYQTIHLYCSIF